MFFNMQFFSPFVVLKAPCLSTLTHSTILVNIGLFAAWHSLQYYLPPPGQPSNKHTLNFSKDLGSLRSGKLSASEQHIHNQGFEKCKTLWPPAYFATSFGFYYFFPRQNRASGNSFFPVIKAIQSTKIEEKKRPKRTFLSLGFLRRP